VTDIVKYGTVQRAYLGISYPQQELSEEQIKKLESDYKVKIGDVQGIVVTDVLEGGAAKVAGIKVGDILTKINGTPVTSSPELQEQIAKYKPNDKITITLKRDNKDLTVNATLKAKLGNTDLASSSKAAEKLGGKLETIDKATAEKNDVEEFYEALKKLTGATVKLSGVYPGFFGNYAFMLNLNE
jgi:predicted metalloprotease with PDZ domain